MPYPGPGKCRTWMRFRGVALPVVEAIETMECARSIELHRLHELCEPPILHLKMTRAFINKMQEAPSRSPLSVRVRVLLCNTTNTSSSLKIVLSVDNN